MNSAAITVAVILSTYIIYGGNFFSFKISKFKFDHLSKYSNSV